MFSVAFRSHVAMCATTQLLSEAAQRFLPDSVKGSTVEKVVKAVASVFLIAPLAYTASVFVGSWALPVIVLTAVGLNLASNFIPALGTGYKVIEMAAKAHMYVAAALTVISAITYAPWTVAIGAIVAGGAAVALSTMEGDEGAEDEIERNPHRDPNPPQQPDGVDGDASDDEVGDDDDDDADEPVLPLAGDGAAAGVDDDDGE